MMCFRVETTLLLNQEYITLIFMHIQQIFVVLYKNCKILQFLYSHNIQGNTCLKIRGNDVFQGRNDLFTQLGIHHPYFHVYTANICGFIQKLRAVIYSYCPCIVACRLCRRQYTVYYQKQVDQTHSCTNIQSAFLHVLCNCVRICVIHYVVYVSVETKLSKDCIQNARSIHKCPILEATAVCHVGSFG